MMETPSSDDLYDRLMALNHDAMEADVPCELRRYDEPSPDGAANLT